MIGLVLIAVGLILLYAVHIASGTVDVHAIGAILVVVGIVEFLVELLVYRRFWNGWR
jgi:hypothetical protein